MISEDRSRKLITHSPISHLLNLNITFIALEPQNLHPSSEDINRPENNSLQSFDINNPGRASSLFLEKNNHVHKKTSNVSYSTTTLILDLSDPFYFYNCHAFSDALELSKGGVSFY